MTVEPPLLDQDIERLADHITKFSVTALKGWKS